MKAATVTKLKAIGQGILDLTLWLLTKRKTVAAIIVAISLAASSGVTTDSAMAVLDGLAGLVGPS